MPYEPKVTIVTVTYQLIASGREDYFRECVESVHNQTHKNIEHIVIDGASNDGTLALIQEYADRGWLTYISEPDSGIYDAMNKGVARASGEYIAFLNSDDFYHNPRAVEFSVQALEKTKASLSLAPWRIVKKKRHQDYMPHIEQCWHRIAMCHQSIVCTTDLLRQHGLFDTSLHIAADYHWLLKVLASGTLFVEIAEPIVTFRQGGLSTTQETATLQETLWALYDVMHSRTNISWEDVCRIQATGYLQWDALRDLVAAYPQPIRDQFYRNNAWQWLKNLRKNLIHVRLKRGKRDIRLLGWTFVSDRHIPEPPVWAKDVVR